jgi:hypothetical protein
MNTLVVEYRSLPPNSDHLPDTGPNDRKCKILREFDEQVDDPEVSQLLLEILQNPLEFDLARVEAIQVAGLYVTSENPLAEQIWAQLYRIAESDEDEMLQGWAQRYVELQRQQNA